MTDESLVQRLTKRMRQLSPEKLLVLEQFLTQLAAVDPTPIPAGQPPRSRATPAMPPCRVWPHAPTHRLSEHDTYLVTAGTLHKDHTFATVERLDFLEVKLLELARRYNWALEAWAVFSNHYHLVGHSNANSGRLNTFLSHLHTATAGFVNRLDAAPERKVWFNFWETQLTYERSYHARLSYVHQNAVKHGLVRVANRYRWCSAAWLERTATRSQVRTIFSFKTDRVKVFDDFDVLAPEE